MITSSSLNRLQILSKDEGSTQQVAPWLLLLLRSWPIPGPCEPHAGRESALPAPAARKLIRE